MCIHKFSVNSLKMQIPGGISTALGTFAEFISICIHPYNISRLSMYAGYADISLSAQRHAIIVRFSVFLYKSCITNGCIISDHGHIAQQLVISSTFCLPISVHSEGDIEPSPDSFSEGDIEPSPVSFSRSLSILPPGCIPPIPPVFPTDTAVESSVSSALSSPQVMI